MSDKGYFRSTDTNPNWLSSWAERIHDGDDYEEVLDVIARLACGIEEASADTVQKYAKHIRTHIQAAFLVGKAAEGLKDDKTNLIKELANRWAKVEALEKEVKELKGTLIGYTAHKSTCMVNQGECTCGLEKLLNN